MAKKSSRREQPAPEEDNANFEGDLQPLLDDLAALREALGNSFKEPSTDEFGDWDEGLAGPHHPLDETPGVEVSLEERIRLVTEALEANQALQARLKRLIASVERAQDKAVGIKDSVQDRLNRRLVASQAPRTQPVRRESAQYTGRSWFWSVPDAPPPPAYPDSSDVLPVTASLPLVLRRASWSEDERNLLRDGVLQTVQEHLFNRFLSEFEAGSAAGAGATLADFQAKQAPIRDLNVYSPVVEETGAAFSDEQWATVAHRHVHGRTPLECKLQWRNAARPSLGKDEFTPEEASQLQELVEEHGDRAWATIAEQLEGHAPLACLAKYQQLRQAQREPGEFTDHDLQRLIPLVQKHGTSWRRLAENFGGKWTPDQLCHFWRRHEQRTEGGTVAPRKGRWEPEEDDALYKAVALLGDKWSKVAKLVPGRTDVQCRERYKNCLDPNVNMQQFTAEEDAALEAAVAAHLAQSPEAAIPWSAIAKLLPGRTDSQVAKRWKAAIQAQSWRGKGGRQQSQPAEATPVASRGKKRGRKKGSTLPSPSKEEVPLVAGVSRSGRKVIRPASLAAYDDPDGGSLPWKALAAATAAATEAEEDGDEQCGACRGASEGRAGGDALWVGCDACSTWYHADCVGMTKADVDAVRDSPWYCASCRQ